MPSRVYRSSPDELRRRAERMKLQLTRDPLMARTSRDVVAAMRRGETRWSHGLDPWEVLGEQRFAALTMLKAIDDERIELRIGDRADRLTVCVSVADTLMRAEPYLWTGEILKTAHAAPLPKHVVGPDLLAHPSMYWSTSLSRHEVGDKRYETNWTLLTTAISDTLGPDRPIMIVRDRVDHAARRMEIVFNALRYGEVYPDDFVDEADPGRLEFARQLLSQLAFMDSPYVTTSRARMPRPVRKELNREAGKEGRPPPPEQVVNVVELRREVRERISRDEARDAELRESKGRDYQHHWWVSGHFRAQWMPSTESHKVIWIAPYLKGPMDKPLLDRRVYVVDR